MTAVAPNPTRPTHPAPAAPPLGSWRERLRRTEMGSLPVLLGLVLLWGVFASQNENFLSARNLTNLVLQIAAMGTMSVGIVLVLLLGEIDLSVGAVSGLCAAVMAVLNVAARGGRGAGALGGRGDRRAHRGLPRVFGSRAFACRRSSSPWQVCWRGKERCSTCSDRPGPSTSTIR